MSYKKHNVWVQNPSSENVMSVSSGTTILSDGGSGFFKRSHKTASGGDRLRMDRQPNKNLNKENSNKDYEVLQDRLQKVDDLQEKIAKLQHLIDRLKQLRTARNPNLKRLQRPRKLVSDPMRTTTLGTRVRLPCKTKHNEEVREVRLFKRRLLEINELQRKIERLDKMIQTKQTESEKLRIGGEKRKLK